MYKYKQTTDVEVGDLVVWTDISKYHGTLTKDKVYQVTNHPDQNTLNVINDKGNKNSYGKGFGFKVLQTKPASEAVVGDYMYRITSGTDAFPQHTIIKITETDNRLLYYKPTRSMRDDEVIVIAQAEQTSEYPVFKEDIKLGFIFKYTGPYKGIYLTNKGIPHRKPGEYLSSMSSEDNAGWNPCDFTIQPDIEDIDWWQQRFEAGLPVFVNDLHGTHLCVGMGPKTWKQEEATVTFGMTDHSLTQKTPLSKEDIEVFKQQVPLSTLHLGSREGISIYTTTDCSSQSTTKEHPMKLQQLLDTIFGVSDYEAKPKFIVTVFNNDKEVATTTAESVEEIQQTIQSDTRLWGCKLVAYKIHSELQTQVPVAITKFKKESNTSAE